VCVPTWKSPRAVFVYSPEKITLLNDADDASRTGLLDDRK